MKKWFLATVVTILFSGCSTLDVEVDYDPEYKFLSLSSFCVVYTNQNDGRDFSRDRISKLLGVYMQEKGYLSVGKSEADFYLIMHLDVQKKSQIETNYETIGIRPSPYLYTGVRPPSVYPRIRPYGAMVMEPDVRVVTRTHDYEEGNLVFEVFDVKENRVVWQGVAKDNFSKDYNQEERSAYINKVISEVFKDFPSKPKK